MIKNGIEVIKTAFDNATGDGKFITLYFITLVIAFMYIKDKDNRTFLINYVIVIILIVFNPIVANILNKILDGGIYWRMFWCMPLGITVAYIFTEIIFNNENKYKKVLVSMCLIGIIIFAGETTYRGDIFYDTDNWLKLPDEHVEIVYTILQDMGEGNEEVLLFAPPEINAHIRQITSKIKLKYERNPYGDYRGNWIYECLVNNDFEGALLLLKDINCNYFVWDKRENLSKRDLKVELILESSKYYVYKINY